MWRAGGGGGVSSERCHQSTNNVRDRHTNTGSHSWTSKRQRERERGRVREGARESESERERERLAVPSAHASSIPVIRQRRRMQKVFILFVDGVSCVGGCVLS